MPTHRILVIGFLGARMFAQPLAAQRGGVAVHGIVFDSLRGRPLRDAFVTIGGTSRAITTDSHGRFELNDVAPGVHTITAHHALLDSIGLTGLTTRATIAADDGDVHLAVPSFETLWRLSCHSPAPHDSGLVFGTIRSAVTGAPVRGATVDVSWWDLRLDENHHVVERTWHMDARSNDRGSYAVCGVPREASVSIQASIDSSASGTINLPLTDVRVQRRDLRIGPIADSTGAITGLVTDPDGNVLQGARVARDGTRNEVRSAPDGRFTLIDAPPGTRSLEARFIGTVPTVSAADVRPGDTTEVVIRVPRAVALAAMRTIATYGVRVLAAEFAERRRLGWGYMRDSLELSKYSELVNALRDVPGMSVQYRGVSLRIALPDGKGGSCAPDVIIDGGSAALGHLIDLSPAEIGGLEVYTRADHIPERFVQPGIHPQCGMILVWTKYGFRNR